MKNLLNLQFKNYTKHINCTNNFLDNIISIKDARIKRGLSTQDLSKALKLDLKIIQLLEENKELPDKFKSYSLTYKNSIYRYLGYEIKYKNSTKNIPIDYTKLSITYFLLLLIFTVLVLLSSNIYNKFNNQKVVRNINFDEIHQDIINLASNYDLSEINSNEFINNLESSERIDFSEDLKIFTKPNEIIYYKVQHNTKKTIQFGEILHANELILDLDNDFSIDLSNINNIEKIIYRGIEIKLKNNLNFYLLNFRITELEKLL